MSARLLVVIGTLDLGGTERHLLDVLPRLDRSLVSPSVFALRGGGVLMSAMEEAGVPVHAPAPGPAGVVGLLRAWLALRRLWHEQRPQIVHYFLPAAYLLGVTCALFTPFAMQIMSRRSLNLYQTRYPGVRSAERMAHRRMRAVLGNSRSVVAELAAEGIGRERLGLLPNGVDLTRMEAAPARAQARLSLGIAADACLLVCVANLIPYKGHDDLLEALAGVASQLPASWRLAFVGRDDGLGAGLRARAATLGIAGHCLWLGQREDVATWLAAADIGLLASHQEGFSNAVLEMMAAGLAIVVTRVGGNPDVVEDGVTGLLVPARDSRAMGAAIARLAAAPRTREALGARAAAVVARRFSLDACVARYEAVYRGLLSTPGESIPALLAHEPPGPAAPG